MYAKILLTHTQTGEEKMVMFKHDYGDNPTAILDNYEAQHPTFIRARNFDTFAGGKWAYRLEQNFPDVTHKTLLREWKQYRDTAPMYTGIRAACGVVYHALRGKAPLTDGYAYITEQLKKAKPIQEQWALESVNAYEYFLSECEAIGVTDGLPTTHTK